MSSRSFSGICRTAQGQKVARQDLDSIAQPFSLERQQVSRSASISASPRATPEYDTPEEILRDADIAMHYAKEKNTGVAVFTKELRVRFLERIRFEIDLRHAIDRDELSMQLPAARRPARRRARSASRRCCAGTTPSSASIPPNKFIPIAEESGLIIRSQYGYSRRRASSLPSGKRSRPNTGPDREREYLGQASVE